MEASTIRVTIAVEGIKDSGIPHILDHDAVIFNFGDGDEYPIMHEFGNTLEDYLGKARNVRREEDGRITAEVPLELCPMISKSDPTPLYDFCIELSDVEWRDKSWSDPNKVVFSGKLRSIGRVPAFREFQLLQGQDALDFLRGTAVPTPDRGGVIELA